MRWNQWLIRLFVLVSFNITTAAAWAIPLPWFNEDELGTWGTELGLNLTFDDRYQIGPEWGKTALADLNLDDLSQVIQRAAMATASIGGGTSFYLGQFNGEHVMATNHHVCPEKWSCTFKRISFPVLGITFTVKKFLGTWSQVDLSLFTIDVSRPEDVVSLANVAGNFDFFGEVTKGEPLVTIGFGSAHNSAHDLMIGVDDDCKVFSKTSEYRFIPDPDRLNPADYKAWSFANGCDISHGDSGSALVGRVTGQVKGIIWTGNIPKMDKVRDAAFLDNIFQNDAPEVWSELSYAVPAPKIGEELKNLAQGGTLDQKTISIIEALLK